MYNERIVRIIYGDHSSNNVPAMVYSLLKQHSRISAELIDVKSFGDLITQAQDTSMAGLNAEDALSLILFATFEPSVLFDINTVMPDSVHAREAIKQNINLVSFLPSAQKGNFNAKKLKLKPMQIVWYDAGNPFSADSDVFAILQKWFADFTLQQSAWK